MFIGKTYIPLVRSSGTSISGDVPLAVDIIIFLLGLCCIGMSISVFKQAWYEDITSKLILFPVATLMFVLGLCFIIAPFVGG